MKSARGAARSAVSILVLGTMALNTGACALAFTQGPPRNHAQRTFFHCDKQSMAAVYDIVAAALWSPTIFGGFAFGFSAIGGFTNASRCRTARREFDASVGRLFETPEGKRPDITIVSVAVSGGDTVRVGLSAQLRASAITGLGTSVAGRLFDWSSANAAVLAVDESGALSAKAPGSVEISAVTGGIKGSRTIVVVP